jgi:hypothetical protein
VRAGRRLALAGAPLVLLALAGAPCLIVARALLGRAACVLLGAAACLFLLDAAAVLGLEPFALAPLGLQLLMLEAHGLLGLVAPVIELVLLGARLLLEHVALDVVAGAANLDTHGAGAPLGAGELELALRLALEGDLARRAVALGLAAVAAAQVRQELQLGIVADAILGPFDLDAGLIELHQQPVDRHLEDLRELGNGHFRHRFKPRSRTTGHAPS